jgi:hypothetical protein
MYRLITIVVILSLILFAGCAGPKKQTGTTPATSQVISTIPDWFENPPSDPNYLFGLGTAVSTDMGLARDKASEAARMDLAKAIETRFQGLSKRFQEEVGTDANIQYLDMFTQATKSTVNTVLTGVSIDKSKLLNEGGKYRAYIMVKMAVGATSEALLNKLKKEEQMYTRFRASQVFQELEDETQKYDQWKKEQGQ